MLAQTGFALNLTFLGAGTMNNDLKDFISSKQRVNGTHKYNRYQLMTAVVVVFLIWGLSSWL